MKQTFCKWGSKISAAVKRAFQKGWYVPLIVLAVGYLICAIFAALAYLNPPQPVIVIIMLASLLCITTAAAYAGIKSGNAGSFVTECVGAMIFYNSLRQLMLYPDGNVDELSFWAALIVGVIMAVVAAFLIVLWADDLR